MLTGGCCCGDVRYQAAGTLFDQTNCHCSICRRTTGAAFVTWFSVKRSDFHIVLGEPTQFRSSVHAKRTFCPRCGTHLTFESENEPGVIDISTCSLDDAEAVPPRDHTWTGSRLSWIMLADGLPEFHEARKDS